jgi:PPP family 3-phenylpropionic acid transporter
MTTSRASADNGHRAPRLLPVPARLALFYGGIFATIGVLLPFWPLWLASRGLGPAEIGVLAALPVWVKVAANPLVAGLADRLGERRRPMVVLALGALAGYGLFALADGFWPLFAISLLCGCFFMPLMPLAESLTLIESHARGFDYGRVRLWGSLAFIAASALAGRLLVGRPEELILWLVLGALALTLLAAVLLPDRRVPTSAVRPGGLGRLLRSPVFLVFLASTGLIQASHAVLYGFGTLHWRAQGLSGGTIGWLWAIGVVAEILLFAGGAAAVRRLGPVGLIGLAAAAGVVRWTTTGLSAALPVLVVAQMLHALTFGAAHLGAMHFIARAVPAEISASAQSLYSALAMGAVAGIALMSSGALFGAVGASAFHAMAILALAGGAAALVLSRLCADGPLRI